MICTCCDVVYIAAMLSGVWYLAWLVVARHNMSQHPWISHDEKRHILQSSHTNGTPPVCSSSSFTSFQVGLNL